MQWWFQDDAFVAAEIHIGQFRVPDIYTQDSVVQQHWIIIEDWADQYSKSLHSEFVFQTNT